MSSKVLLAIVAVIVVAAAGAGAFLLLNNGSGESVDEIREELSVGDYIEHVSDIAVLGEKKSEGAHSSALLEELYICAGGEVVSTKTIDYKGEQIECNVYIAQEDDATMTTVNDPVSNMAYQIYLTKQSLSTSRILKDTSLPTSKEQSEQIVSEGTYAKWDTSLPYDGQDNIMLRGIEEYRFVSFDPSTSEGDLMIIDDMKLNDTIRLEIGQITSDGKYIYKGSSDIHSKTDFLSNIDFECELEYLKDNGYTIARGDKVQKTIDTEFGKRHVTVETLNCTKDTEKRVYQYTYGDSGAIYSVLCKRDDVGLHLEGTVELKGTSLFK